MHEIKNMKLYTVLISNIHTISNHKKQVVIFYNLLTQYFKSAIDFFDSICMHTLFDKFKNLTITFYNDVIWKCTYKTEP